MPHAEWLRNAAHLRRLDRIAGARAASDFTGEDRERNDDDRGDQASTCRTAIPFLLIDRVVAFEKDKRIVALKNVTVNEPFFQGHFPHHPVMPGVLDHRGDGAGGGGAVAAQPSATRTTASGSTTSSASTARASSARSCPATSSCSRSSRARVGRGIGKFAARGEGGRARSPAEARAAVRPAADPMKCSGVSAHPRRRRSSTPRARLGADVQRRARTRSSTATCEIGRGHHDRRAHRDHRPHHASAATTASSSSARSARPTRTRSTGASRRGSRSATATPSASTARLNRGTVQDAGVTRIGNDNWIMAYCHVAHDCQVGNHTVFANNATLAGTCTSATTRSSAASPACTSSCASART